MTNKKQVDEMYQISVDTGNDRVHVVLEKGNQADVIKFENFCRSVSLSGEINTVPRLELTVIEMEEVLKS